MASRGTDPATERRRLRKSDDDEDAIARWLDATFWVSAEAFLFGLPALVWTMFYGNVAEGFVMVVALSSLCLVGGVVRSRRSEEGERGWPRMSPRLVGFRVLYYNAALAGTVAVGAALVTESIVRVEWATDPILGPAAVAGLLAGLAAWALPTAASAVER